MKPKNNNKLLNDKGHGHKWETVEECPAYCGARIDYCFECGKTLVCKNGKCKIDSLYETK